MMSEDEFAREFQSSWRALWCVAVSVLNDRALAEDALQESAIIGLRKRGEFTPGTGFIPWMSAIVRFVALNQGRKAARRKSVTVDPAVIDQSHGGAPMRSAESEKEMFDEHISAALETLSETARQCLLMRTLFDSSYSEIATKLGIPEGTAMSHVHRARRALRKWLEHNDAENNQGRKGDPA